jgi:hypothetical protein
MFKFEDIRKAASERFKQTYPELEKADKKENIEGYSDSEEDTNEEGDDKEKDKKEVTTKDKRKEYKDKYKDEKELNKSEALKALGIEVPKTPREELGI